MFSSCMSGLVTRSTTALALSHPISHLYPSPLLAVSPSLSVFLSLSLSASLSISPSLSLSPKTALEYVCFVLYPFDFPGYTYHRLVLPRLTGVLNGHSVVFKRPVAFPFKRPIEACFHVHTSLLFRALCSFVQDPVEPSHAYISKHITLQPPVIVTQCTRFFFQCSVLCIAWFCPTSLFVILEHFFSSHSSLPALAFL